MHMYMLSTCLHDRELGLEGGGGGEVVQPGGGIHPGRGVRRCLVSLSLSSVSVDQYTFLQKCIDRYLSI